MPSTRVRRRSSVDELHMAMALKAKEGRKRKEYAVRPLLKRNTISDFAASKVLHGSTTSLLSTNEQDKLGVPQKKNKSAFSLLKLKNTRIKEDHKELKEVFTSIIINEFKDEQIKKYKIMHWTDMIDEETLKLKDEKLINKENKKDLTEIERKRREAVWELFKSECIFLVDHLSVLKNCYHEPLKKVQVEGCVMNADVDLLFGNIDELLYCSYTFCKDFINTLLLNFRKKDFAGFCDIRRAFRNICVLTRNGEVYHDYCLNYSKVPAYLEQLKKDEEFVEFEKLCLQVEQCRRLQLSDLLISPLQHCTKMPLLLHNIKRYSTSQDDQLWLSEAVQQLEASLVHLETKMVSLNNYERIKEIQQQIVWQPITTLEPRAYIPDFLRCTLSKQPCEKLLTCSERKLLYEGQANLIEISKVTSMYLFLFDDILLLTKLKKNRRGLPKNCSPCTSDLSSTLKPPNENYVFVVYRQPLALDRFTIHDVKPPDSPGLTYYGNNDLVNGIFSEDSGSDTGNSNNQEIKEKCLPHLEDCQPSQRPHFLFSCMSTSNVLKNAFVLIQINRFQQIIGVYTLQTDSNANKLAWIQHIYEAQEAYRESLEQAMFFLEKPVSPFFSSKSFKSKALFSNIKEKNKKKLSPPSIEQLNKAPGIRSRSDSRTSKVIKDSDNSVFQDNHKMASKIRSASSEAPTPESPESDLVIRRTSDPTSSSSNPPSLPPHISVEKQTLFEEQNLFIKDNGNLKVQKTPQNLILSHQNLPESFNPQLTLSDHHLTQSHHHLGQINQVTNQGFFIPPSSFPQKFTPRGSPFPWKIDEYCPIYNPLLRTSSSLYPSSLLNLQSHLNISDYDVQQSTSASNVNNFYHCQNQSAQFYSQHQIHQQFLKPQHYSLQQLQQISNLSSQPQQLIPQNIQQLQTQQILKSPEIQYGNLSSPYPDFPFPPSSSSYLLKPPIEDEDMMRHSSLRIKKKPNPLVAGLKVNIEKSQSSDIIKL